LKPKFKNSNGEFCFEKSATISQKRKRKREREREREREKAAQLRKITTQFNAHPAP